MAVIAAIAAELADPDRLCDRDGGVRFRQPPYAKKERLPWPGS
ncbi:hypothetical protein [Bradyrhizobium brasilense]|nr:hypothetical protein [Bradyrhizobium brasilense]